MHDATSIERARSALSYLNPNCDRDTWVKYGMCLKHEFGDAGFDLWDEWSSQSDKYRAMDARATWKSIKAAGNRTIATLFYDAKQGGWKDDAKYKKPTKAEIEERKAAAAARAEQAAKEQAEAHEKAAAWAQSLWDAAQPCESHPYLTRKGVASYGLRVGRWERIDEETGEVTVVANNALLIPIRDRQRKLWSLQGIFVDPNAKKLYLKGGAKRGFFFPIGKPQQRDGRPVFILGEGYATCASAHAATGHMVLVCFDVANLMSVAQAVRERSPDAWIVLAADNDTETEGNPGLTTARKVAAEVGGLVAVPPPGDFNDLQAAEGMEAVAGCIEAAFAPAPEPEPEADPLPWEDGPPQDGGEQPEAKTEQPELPADPFEGDTLLSSQYFTVLGYDGDDYYVFHHEKRQVVCRTRSHFSCDQALVDLAPINWWETYFPNLNGKGSVNRILAFEWFLGVAHARGIYDSRRIRGRGAWRDNGRTVFHHGNYLSVDGVRTEIAQIESRWVYPMAQSMPAPAADPVTDAEGQHLLDVAKMARWTRPGSAALLAGWVFLAPVCGALNWRPHIWLTGAAGSGKSTIQSGYVDALLSGIGWPLQGDSSEAGIRQTLQCDAVPALIDEFEPNDESDRKRMKNVLTLIRQASSETAAQTVKGSVSGDSVRYHIRSMFCLASINTMLDKDSDQSRITPLVLRPPAKTGSADDQWQALEECLHNIGRDGRWPARLLARSLSMLPTIIANAAAFCRAAAIRFGTQRLGDQYGTLLSGAWSLTNSKVATDDEALAMINSYDWTEHTESTGGPGDPEKALAAIMESKVRVSNVDVTIHEILSEACGRPASSTQVGTDLCLDILRRNGIRVEGKTLVFGVNTGTLKALVKDTAYATDLRGQLSRLPGASNMGNKTRKFAGVNSKLIRVPLSLVIEDDEDPPI